MRRKRRTAAMIAGTAIVLGLLAAFAIGLSHNQSQSRSDLEHQARQRAVLVADLLTSLFRQATNLSASELRSVSTATVPDRVIEGLKGTSDFVALLDARGRVIAHSTGFDAQARRAVRTGAAVRGILAGRPWMLGDRFPYPGGGAVELAERLPTSHGTRVLVTGIREQTIGPLVASALAQVPGAARQHQIMVDGNGVVIGSTVPDRPPGYVFGTAIQRRVLSRASGIVRIAGKGARYFDSVPLTNSTWRLLLTIPVGEFFASVSGSHHWLPWIIFGAFGLMAVAALALVLRAVRDADRISRANQRLVSANAELGAARAGLEESNAALGRSNDALERQARELVRSNAELDQFASIASHDLQEPLRKIRTFTERISETEAASLSERGADYLRRANASAERMQILIEDLLRFSRVSTQARPFAPVDLASVTADVVDDLAEQIRRTDARIELGPLPTINADASQMHQLMQNLISNALKFRREGVAPIVRVTATLDGDWITLTVADNGIGFDPRYARRIFRVFERLHGRGTYPGTGIGLALCRKIAERHGGSIVADSAGDTGAIFTVTMQTRRSEAVSDAPPESTGGSASREEPYVPA